MRPVRTAAGLVLGTLSVYAALAALAAWGVARWSRPVVAVAALEQRRVALLLGGDAAYPTGG
ncbi:hypothetical protein MUU72_04625 [Streptomyces sp. RS10V-4]|uniref:hypothetical protein n=1 Tax=Streptomyces rhizoryzae TaxID=2932493 RepID=UPI002002D8FB|nr:hypothetical protein [Streptomyces rhizoryzae]MCK7622408.1 hypothetical protein [Streptomyces rhizoryzae]